MSPEMYARTIELYKSAILHVSSQVTVPPGSQRLFQNITAKTPPSLVIVMPTVWSDRNGATANPNVITVQ